MQFDEIEMMLIIIKQFKLIHQIKKILQYSNNNINNVNINNYFDFYLLKETNKTKSTNIKTFTGLNESNESFSLTNKQINDDLSEIISNSIKEWILNLRADVYLSLLNHNNTFSLLLIAIEYNALEVAQIAQLIKLFSIDQ